RSLPRRFTANGTATLQTLPRNPSLASALLRSALCLHIKSPVEKRRKRINDGHATRVLPRNQIFRQNAPRTLRVANAMAAGKFINGEPKLNAVVHDLLG